MPSRLGIDMQDTGSDLLLLDPETGATQSIKVSHAPESAPQIVGNAILELAGRAGIQPGEIDAVVGALTPDGAPAPRVGLLVTDGFQHVLHLGRGRSGGAFGPAPSRPTPMLDLAMVAGIDERLSAQGNTIKQLDRDAARRAVSRLAHAGARALAVCLINAQANPAHEDELRAIAEEVAPDLKVYLSHEVAPEAGEYERALATVLTAQMQAGLAHQIAVLQAGLRAAEVSPNLDIARADGGMASPSASTAAPLCVPGASRANAARAAATIAARAGQTDALALEIGGGAASTALIRGGQVRVGQQRIGAETLPAAALDVREVGGGSHTRAMAPFPGVIRLAPPLAHGDGPTVQMASIVLGRLPTLTGRIAEEAERAIASFAKYAGLAHHAAAEAVIAIFEEQLAGALRVVAAEKGEDPTRMALVACGGAGPAHAAAIAALLGASTALVPKDPATLAALGCARAERSAQFAQACGARLDAPSTDQIDRILQDLTDRAQTWLTDEGATGTIDFRADLSVDRGDFQISAPVQRQSVAEVAGIAALGQQLADAHQNRFGHRPHQPARLATLRAIVRVARDQIPPHSSTTDSTARAAPSDEVQAYFDGAFRATAVYDRAGLAAGARISGPALITESGTTTVVGPGHRAEVDRSLTIVIRPDGGR